MTETTRQLHHDPQAAAPDIPIGLSRAGVTGVQKAVRIGRGAQEKLIAATIDCTVDLDPSQKGVHMSRFPELFEEAIEGVVADDAFLIEDLAEHVATRIVERQHAVVAEVQIRARYPYERTTPVTKLSTQEMVTLIGVAAASRASVRRIVGVEAIGINACPCAQGLVRDKASERLLEAGFGEHDVERILQLVPIATHNQRGQGTLLVGTSRRVNAERLVELVEASMSSPIYELLKRPDELFVVEHAHLQPRFVEDSVRVALQELLETMAELDDEDFVLSRQRNLETIHDHDVVAARWGTVGEIRAALRGAASPTEQTTLETWLRA
jgi:MptA/FolE2 family GTP cyclohydrolase